MAQTPEGKVKDRIKALLKEYDAYYYMPVPTGFGVQGIPDFVVCCNGHFLGVEAKAGKGKTSAHQDRQLKLIAQAGGTALVINEHNLDTLRAVLRACAGAE